MVVNFSGCESEVVLQSCAGFVSKAVFERSVSKVMFKRSCVSKVVFKRSVSMVVFKRSCVPKVMFERSCMSKVVFERNCVSEVVCSVRGRIVHQ